MKSLKRRRILIASVLVAVCLGTAYWWRSRNDHQRSDANREAAEKGNPHAPRQVSAGPRQITKAGEAATASLPAASPEGYAISLESIRKVLDPSMAAVGAAYVTHQAIAHSGMAPSLSFVYSIQTNRPGANPPTKQALILAAGKALGTRVGAKRLLEEGQREGNADKMRNAAQALVAGDREATRVDSFLSVEIGTTNSVPPVMMFQQGLPDWIVHWADAASLAAEALGSNPYLTEISSAGPGAGLVYAFERSDGQRAYVDVRSRQVYAHREASPGTGARRPLSDQELNERQVRIQQQWEEFLSSGIDMKQFSLEGLIDLSKQRSN